MKRTKRVLLAAILIALVVSPFCRQRIKIIPEITAHISEESIHELGGKDAVAKIIKSGGKLAFITLNGEILLLDPETRVVESPYNLSMEIEPAIFHQDDFLILKQRQPNRTIIFNLADRKEEKVLKGLRIDRVIGVDRDLLIYRVQNRVVFLAYHSGKVLAKEKVKKETLLYNSAFLDDRVLVLSSLHLFTYHKKRNSLERAALKDRPASGFLLDRGSLYYGSVDRRLVKLSLKSRKTSWRFELPAILESMPQKAGPYITVTPSDNNIYFFTPKGSLHWWSPFDSPQALPAVVMGKNVAVFLMNREFRKMNNKIRFFNYKDKKVVSYQFKYQLESNPVYVNNNLYILCRDSVKGTKTLSRIGNRHDLEIEISPDEVKPPGKSVRFKLTPINLIDPEIDAKVLDRKGSTVFEKQIAKGEQPVFVWIPEKPGDYKVVLAADAENKKKLSVEQGFKVVDVEKIVGEYYYRLQKECSGDFPDPAELEREKKKD